MEHGGDILAAEVEGDVAVLGAHGVDVLVPVDACGEVVDGEGEGEGTHVVAGADVEGEAAVAGEEVLGVHLKAAVGVETCHACCDEIVVDVGAYLAVVGGCGNHGNGVVGLYVGEAVEVFGAGTDGEVEGLDAVAGADGYLGIGGAVEDVATEDVDLRDGVARSVGVAMLHGVDKLSGDIDVKVGDQAAVEGEEHVVDLEAEAEEVGVDAEVYVVVLAEGVHRFVEVDDRDGVTLSVHEVVNGQRAAELHAEARKAEVEGCLVGEEGGVELAALRGAECVVEKAVGLVVLSFCATAKDDHYSCYDCLFHGMFLLSGYLMMPWLVSGMLTLACGCTLM